MVIFWLVPKALMTPMRKHWKRRQRRRFGLQQTRCCALLVDGERPDTSNEKGPAAERFPAFFAQPFITGMDVYLPAAPGSASTPKAITTSSRV